MRNTLKNKGIFYAENRKNQPERAFRQLKKAATQPKLKRKKTLHRCRKLTTSSRRAIVS